MRAQVWGCRGSVAAPGSETVRYGGNTSCVAIELESGHTLVLDAGTGLRPLGAELAIDDERELHLLLTHLHMDHLQGLGFFRPLYRPGLDVHIWGPASPIESLAERIALYLSPPLFPVRLNEIPAHLTFHDAPQDEPVTIGSATVRASKVKHQGPTVAYRIEENGRAIVYMPDHEPSLGVELRSQPAEWISGHDIAHGADVLLHDAQYLDDEYPNHIGWGHSCVEHAIDFAQKTDVDMVVLFHHDPYHTDDDLEPLLASARARWDGSDEQVCLAHEGMSITLDAEGVTRR